MKQTVLVTGGCGFIGNYLVRLLRQKDYCVINYDALTYAARAPEIVESEDYRLVVGDVCDAEKLSVTLDRYRPQWVMHLAAETHVDYSISDATSFMHSNISGTFSLLNVLRDYQDKFPDVLRKVIQVSTDEVYGSLSPWDAPIEVGAPYRPQNPYSASKASADCLARAWKNTYQLPIIMTHCGNNFGGGQLPDKLIARCIVCALSGQKFPLYGDGKNIRDWVFVGDHVRALLNILESGTIGSTYHIGAHNEISNIDLIHKIARIVAEYSTESLLFESVPDRLGHDFRYALRANVPPNAQGEIWQAVDFEQALKDTVLWYIAHRDFWNKTQ